MRSPRTCRAEPAPAVALGELCRDLGLSQVEVSARLGISQPHTAKIEHQEDMHLTTLRRYVSGLGGNLRLIVEFPGSSCEITLDQTTPDQRST